MATGAGEPLQAREALAAAIRRCASASLTSALDFHESDRPSNDGCVDCASAERRSLQGDAGANVVGEQDRSAASPLDPDVRPVEATAALSTSRGQRVWACLDAACLGTPHGLRCGRSGRGHAAAHFQEQFESSGTGAHAVAVGLSDFTVWCYRCNHYVRTAGILEFLAELLAAREIVVAERAEEATAAAAARKRRGQDPSRADDFTDMTSAQRDAVLDMGEENNDSNRDAEDSAEEETNPRSILASLMDQGYGDDSDELTSDASFYGGSDDESSDALSSDDSGGAGSVLSLGQRMGGAALDDSVDIHRLREMTVLREDLDISGVARAIREQTVGKIVILAGAGMSVSAGIPDFRTPGTGLYDNLQKYNLPEPTAIFDIAYYRENPDPFCLFAKEIYPGNFRPTLCHYFARLLHEKGLLLRLFTQNIDTLERVAGMPGDMLVEAHGSFHGAHCIDCRGEADSESVKADFFADHTPMCRECGGYVKPDIVFFGENLPERFFEQKNLDLPLCDMLLVMGTSLQVHPFAGLVNDVDRTCPRVLLNREAVATASSDLLRAGIDAPGFRFLEPSMNVRDVPIMGDLDDCVWKLVNEIGPDWRDDLCDLIRREEPEDSVTRTKMAQLLSAQNPSAPSSPSSSSLVQSAEY